MKAIKCCLLASVLLYGTSCLAVTPNTNDVRVARLREMVSEEIPYEFGTTVKATIIPNGAALRLTCDDNPASVKEILIGANSEHLRIYYILSSGVTIGGGATWAESVGSFRQVGGSVAISMWEIRGDSIHLTFQLTNEDGAILQAYRKLKDERCSWATRSWSDVLDDPEAVSPRLSAAQRVEAFTRLWTTVRFSFANFDLVPELDWDSVLTEYLPKVMHDQSNCEYTLLLQECIARLKDGHTRIGSQWGNGLPSACPPLRICAVEGKAVVVDVAETEGIVASAIEVGDEITHVDGRPVRELLQEDVYPYIAASTPQGRDLKAYPRILHGRAESRVRVTVKAPGGTSREVVLTRKAVGIDLLPRRGRPDCEYRELGGGLVYVAINTFGDSGVTQWFRERFEEIRRAKGLVIDIRENGGGSSRYGHSITAHLIDKAIPASRWKTPQYRAAFRAWGRDEQWYDGGYRMIEPETKEPFRGPIVVLIGPQTYSAAEDFAVGLHASHRATLVGQKSGGSTGQPLRFKFLGGRIFGRVCTKRDQYPDGRDFVGVGIIPDVAVCPTAEDIASDRDAVLDKGIDVLRTLVNQQAGTAIGNVSSEDS
jgi:C-terminal processing protease CtpA/Prc